MVSLSYSDFVDAMVLWTYKPQSVIDFFTLLPPIKQFSLGFAMLSYIIYITFVLEIKTESFIILYCTGKWRNNERNGCESVDTIMHY
jgi:hypothetical protein